MIKKISIIIAALGLSLAQLAASTSTQATLSSQEMVGITPALSSYINLPADAVKSLGTKLNQMVTQNGFGSTSGQFVLTANVVTLDKQATATAPVQYVIDLEVSLFVLNVMEGVIVDEMSYTVKGIDRLENKAVIKAINTINARTPQVRTFMEGVRGKIIEYYNTRIPAIITKAKSLAERNEYEEALYVLSAVPESVDQYPMVAEQMSAIYLKKIDRDATAALQEAKGYVAVRDYDSALTALLAVDPSSSKSAEAFALIEQIKAKLDADEQRALEEKWRIYEDQKEAAQRAHDDAVTLRSKQIEAAHAVGVQQAKTETSTAKRLNDWFFGKFK